MKNIDRQIYVIISDVSDHFAIFTICYDKHIHKANPEDKIVQT